MVHLTTALDAASGVPLYEQLYRSLAAEMRTGAISAGTRMPGKRRLAAELSVSVNTVDAAYQMLAAEGYLEARERSGFYVQEYLALPERTESAAPPQPEAAPAPEQPVRYDLSTRGVDPELFPFRTWARLQKELLYSSPELLTHGDAQGDLSLRQALAEYLEEYRGVRCGPHQLVVGAGLEYLLGLLAPLLPGPAAVENPGYPRARQVLENNGISCCCLPVDEDGLSIRALSESGAAVVYLSTCSRSLAPSIRIAYMVLPEQLLPAWHAKYALYSGTVSRFEQQTLARFITGGYFTRHLARERVAYKARRDALTKALREAFAPEELHLTGLHTGLHLLAELRDPPPDDALRAAAEAEGVRLSLLSDYDLTGGGIALGGTLVLGYGSLADESCASVGETLKRACTAAWESSVRV